MLFNNDPRTKIVAKLPLEFGPRTLTQFYRASPQFAVEKGGKFFQHLLDSVKLSEGKYASIDSRVHMLMPEWYPCIPGWHCDDFYRPNGQPSLEALEPIVHYSVVLGAEVSTTEFAKGPMDLPSPTELYEVYDTDRPLYSYYNELIDEQMATRKIVTRKVNSGEVMRFYGLDFHRGLPATQAGWRAFIRVSVSNHREPRNEIRTQTQVYLTDPFKGW